MKAKGYILAAIAAAAYGTNPAFAVPLYADGMNPVCVLLFRYIFSLPILAAMMAARGRSLSIGKAEAMQLAVLGVLMAVSSLGLFESYNYMNSGVASTLLFVYPVMVAVMMSFFFHEPFRMSTGICLAIMGAGLFMLMKGDAGSETGMLGVVLVMLSSLTYALYLVMTNVSKVLHGVSTLKMLFYVILSGSSVFIFALLLGTPFTVPSGIGGWINLAALALIPTVLSLGCTTAAINTIGSTPTAIFGALEPVTAVVLSVVLLGQDITGREIAGGLLIVAATSIVIASGPVDKVLLRVKKMLPRLRRR
ncbi:MAG: DMT family transporter [Duncaniella sp.]|nr:DMT family transporter [Duncaniella sp.]